MLNTLFVFPKARNRKPTFRRLACDLPAHTHTLMPDLAEYMTTVEAAKELGFTVASVWQMVHKKKLESIRFGRSVLIPREAVKEYIEKTAGMSKNDPRRKLK